MCSRNKEETLTETLFDENVWELSGWGGGGCQQNTGKAIPAHEAKPVQVYGILSHYSSGLWTEFTHEENEVFEVTVQQTRASAGCQG